MNNNALAAFYFFIGAYLAARWTAWFWLRRRARRVRARRAALVAASGGCMPHRPLPALTSNGFTLATSSVRQRS